MFADRPVVPRADKERKFMGQSKMKNLTSEKKPIGRILSVDSKPITPQSTKTEARKRRKRRPIAPSSLTTEDFVPIKLEPTNNEYDSGNSSSTLNIFQVYKGDGKYE